MLVLVLVAWALRVYHLGTQSLWVDEGFSYDVANQGARAILAILPAEDRHPPLHYLLLWATMRIAGTSEFSLRFLSAGSAILAVPLTFAVGRRLGGNVAAVVGAAMIAISPFHVWYAQEARMYALLATLGLGSIYCWLRIVDGDRRWSLGFVLSTIGALYTHYYAVFLLPAEVIAAILLGNWRRFWRRWLALLAISCVLFTPWLLAIWQQYQRAPRGYQPDLPLPVVLAKLVSTYVTGENTPVATWVGVIFVGLVVVGSLPTRQRAIAAAAREPSSQPGQVKRYVTSCQARVGGLVLLGWLLSAPVGAFLVTSLLGIDIRATGQAYYIAGLPAFALLVGRGVDWLAKRLTSGVPAAAWVAAPAIAALVVGGTAVLDGLALRHQYVDIVKEDFRSAAALIDQRLWPGDTIILDAQYIYRPFLYYYRGAAPWNRAVVEAGKVDPAMVQQTSGHGRVWLVLAHDAVSDPKERVAGWLDQHATPLDEIWLNGLHVRLYGMETRPNYTRPAIGQPVSVRFGNQAEVVAVDAPASIPGGQPARVTLVWHSLAPFAEDDHIVLMLNDPAGKVVWQYDHAPISQMYLPTRWQPGEYLTDRYDLVLPPGLPPGKYKLTLKMYAPSSGATVPANGGDRPALGSIEIGPTIATAPLAGADVFPGLRLLTVSSGPGTARPGDDAGATLVWQAIGVPPTTARATLQLVDSTGKVDAEREIAPIGGSYPITNWQPGQVVRDVESIKVPARLPPGAYRLRINGAAAVDVGPVQVAAIAHTNTVPSMQLAQDVTLAAAADPATKLVELLGYDLTTTTLSPGSPVGLDLLWRAAGEPSFDYTVFVHLVGPDGKIHGQSDRTPGDPPRPTSGWLTGDVISDTHQLRLDDNAPPGEYYLEVGMYRPDTGERLAAGAHDAIILNTRIQVGSPQ